MSSYYGDESAANGGYYGTDDINVSVNGANASPADDHDDLGGDIGIDGEPPEPVSDAFGDQHQESVDDSNFMWDRNAVATAIMRSRSNLMNRSMLHSQSSLNRPMAGSSSMALITSHKPLTRPQIMAYSVGHIVNDMTCTCWFTYLLLVMHKVHHMSEFNGGLVLLVGQVADAFATPLVGVLSDRSRGCPSLRLGRRTLFYFIGCIFVLVAFLFMFGMCLVCDIWPDEGETGLLIYFCVAAILYNIGFALVQVPHMSLVPELTPVDQERVVLNSGRYFFTIASNVMIYLLLLLFTSGISVGDGEATKYTYMTYVTIGICVASSLVFLIITREPVGVFDATGERVVPTGGTKWRQWFSEPGFWKVGFIYMCTRALVNVSACYLPFFIEDVLYMGSEYTTILPMALYLSSFVSTLFMKKLNKKLGRKKVLAIGSVFCVSSMAATCFLTPDYQFWFFVPCIFLGLGSAAMMVVSVQLQADLIGQDTSAAAFVYGTLSFADKFMNGIIIFVLQALNTKTEFYYRLSFAIVPGGACVGAFIMMLLTDHTNLRQNKRALNQRLLYANGHHSAHGPHGAVRMTDGPAATATGQAGATAAAAAAGTLTSATGRASSRVARAPAPAAYIPPSH